LNQKLYQTGGFRRRLYQENKKLLDLLKDQSAVPGFEVAVRRLFGHEPEQRMPARIGDHEYLYSGGAKDFVSFLPLRWQEKFAEVNIIWPGCEKWWSGYPLIALAELRPADGKAGHLKLDLEVGPVSNHRNRIKIIEAIKAAASSENMERVRFKSSALEKGSLYSRFLGKNVVVVEDMRDPVEIESRLRELTVEFQPEFELVASLIPSFSSL
jgi:hypothetical protein